MIFVGREGLIGVFLGGNVFHELLVRFLFCHLGKLPQSHLQLFTLLSGLGASEDEVRPGEQAGPTRPGLRARREPDFPERLVRQIGWRGEIGGQVPELPREARVSGRRREETADVLGGRDDQPRRRRVWRAGGGGGRGGHGFGSRVDRREPGRRRIGGHVTVATYQEAARNATRLSETMLMSLRQVVEQVVSVKRERLGRRIIQF